jgi:hypothetical protein
MAKRKMKTYAAYPKSSRFLWHGAGKDYYRAWEDFRRGVSETPPPDFPTFIQEWRANGFSAKKKESRFPLRRRRQKRRQRRR